MLPASIAPGQGICTPVNLTASDGGAFDSFGWSVAVHGDHAAVGAKWDDQAGFDAGAIYVFVRRAGSWIQEQKLTAEGAGPDEELGWALASDANVIIAGTPTTTPPGSVHIFRRERTGWAQEQEIPTPPDAVPAPIAGAGFGRSVAVEGDRAVVGATGESTLGTAAGAVYVFEYDGSNWVQQQKLLASDGSAGDAFGFSVDIADQRIIVGAAGCECAYIFTWTGGEWVEEQIVKPDDPDGTLHGGDTFGSDVAISSIGGGTAVVGAEDDNDNGFANGSAYIFGYDGSTWVQTQELFAVDPPPGQNQNFGRSVSIDEDLMVIGAPLNSLPDFNDGVAYVFRYDGEQDLWVFQEQLLPEPNPAAASIFGRSVSISQGTAIVGAHGENNQAGSAYVFNVAAPGSADLDCDGVVGPDDLAELLAQWGVCDVVEGCPADIAPPSGGGDGIVGPADLAELLANWG